MKKNLCFLFLTGILAFSVSSFGQKTVVVVEPDDLLSLEIGALNKAIADAETAGTAGNTIFELKRDALYLLNGPIAHSDYHLHIRGQEGAGSKPVLQPGVDENGVSGRHFEPSDDLTLENLYIQGRGELGRIDSYPLTTRSDSCDVLVNHCVFDYSDQTILRCGSRNNRIVCMNSVLRNCLRPDNPSNGRVIDTRGNRNRVLWISNSTIYNNGATQLRSDGGFTNLAVFDHNTVYQTSFNHNMALDIMLEVNITNNIFYNFLYRRDNSSHDAFFRCDSMMDFITHTDADRYFDLSDNNWYVQKEIGDVLDEYGPDTLFRFNDWAPNDTIWYREALGTYWFANDTLLATTPPDEVPPILNFIKNGQVDTTGLFREELTFTNPPPLNLEYWKFYTENGWAIGGKNPPNPFADEDPLVLGEVQTGAFDFSYNTDSRSYTAADDGRPLGSLMWWPEYVAVNEFKSVNGIQTFPNPFDDLVTFRVDANEAATMKIRIYDLMGRELHTLYRESGQGVNEFTVDLGRISHTGILLYQIVFETRNGLKTTSSGKIIKN